MKGCLTILHEVHYYTSSKVLNNFRNSLALNFENMLSWVTGLIAMSLGINSDRSFFFLASDTVAINFIAEPTALFFLTGWVQVLSLYQFLHYGNDLNSSDYRASCGTISITQFQKISGNKQHLHLHGAYKKQLCIGLWVPQRLL